MIRPPAHLEPYVQVLGQDLAVEFLLAFGGADLYLARNPQPGSRLVEVVGMDKARELGALAAAKRLQRRVPVGKEWIAKVLLSRGLPIAEGALGIEIEARHRDALHSALMSGAAAAISRGLSWDDAKAAVLAYLRRSVPDALAALDPDYQVLDDLVEGKLREATANSFPLIQVDALPPARE